MGIDTEGESVVPEHVERPHHGIGRLIVRVVFTVFFTRCAVVGRGNIPVSGTPHILAVHGDSRIDLPLVWAFYPEPVFLMAPDSWFSMPVIGWLFERSGNIRCTPATFDTDDMHLPAAYLTEYKRNLAIVLDGSMESAGRTGLWVASLSAKTGAPVVPASVLGTADVLPEGSVVPTYSNRLAIRVGEPLQVGPASEGPDRSRIEELSSSIVSAIAALRRGEGHLHSPKNTNSVRKEK